MYGYTIGVVAPYVMLGRQPMSAIRVTLDVIVPSPTGLTPEKWKQTATLCLLDWPSNYSLLRLWHMTEGIHEFVTALARQMQHRHMFLLWRIDYGKFTNRVLFHRPPNCVSEAVLMQNLQDKEFPDRRVRKTAPRQDVVNFHSKCENSASVPLARSRLNRCPLPFAIAGWVLLCLPLSCSAFLGSSSLCWIVLLLPSRLSLAHAPR